MGPSLIQLGVFFIISLSARALFSFLETSITALRLFRLKELATNTTRYADLFKSLENNSHRVLISILIVNSVADVTTSALATLIMEHLFAKLHLPQGLGFTLGIALATLAILVFGEIIPKNIAKRQGEELFESTLWFINGLYWLMSPLVGLLLRCTDFLIASITGKKTIETASQWVSSEKEIKFLIHHIQEKGLMEAEKTEMLQNILELGNTHVREIMVPATDIVSISITCSMQEALQVFVHHKFTRLPVYEEHEDNIVGMLHLKDIFALLLSNQQKPLSQIIRPILFIPDGIRINQVLRELREQHKHIAIVINEHGSIVGLITMEDLLEEIVGDISDEHEPTTEKIQLLKQGEWLVDASISLAELENFLHIKIEAEDAVTLAGFLAEQLQHLPRKGERVLYKNFYFQIQKASRTRIMQALIFENKE